MLINTDNVAATTDVVTIKKFTNAVPYETSTVNCGWGVSGNGGRVAATWAVMKNGQHIATLLSTPTRNQSAWVVLMMSGFVTPDGKSQKVFFANSPRSGLTANQNARKWAIENL